MIEFQNTEGHECYGERQGENIVFKCPLCPDYKRTLDTKTGEMSSSGMDFPDDWNQMNDYEKDFFLESQPRHYGSFVPPGLDYDGWTPN